MPLTGKQWMGTPPEKCDLCSTPITTTFVDGKTIHGPWANMCQACYIRYGVGLGLGLGQVYEKMGDKWYKTGG